MGQEDDGDHMQRMFSKGPSAEVEVNKRSILADIAMEDGPYEGKKVSRAELFNQDESDEDDDDAESGEGEMDEMEEMGESELSESSESVAFEQELKPRKKQVSDSEDDEETARKKELIKKLEGDQDEQSDDDIDAALDRVIENKTEESKKASTRQVSDLEKAEAVQTQKKVYNTTL